MKLIWYIVLVLVVAAVLFSGYTKLSDNKDQHTVEIIGNGAQVRNANGILFDSNDKLYVTSVFGGEIAVVDPETGEILKRLGIESGVKCPDDLIFGPDGSLYCTNLIVGEVGRLSPDGVISNQSVAPGVNSITFSDDGRLFVALDFMGDGLYELDPSFSKEPRLIAANLGWLNGMDWGSDGYLYGPIWTKGEVVRIDVDSGNITTVAKGFGTPSAVKFDSSGNLYVADYEKGEISRIDLNNSTTEVIASGLERMDNIAFDSNDRLFTSAEDGTIFEVLANGSTREVLKRGMIGPGGVAVQSNPNSGNDSVFIADLSYLRELDGQTGREIYVERHLMGDISNYNGTESGKITSPITVSSDGKNLIISSWVYNVVQVWDPVEHKLIQEYLNFSVPMNAIAFQGDLVVAELGMEEGAAQVLRVNDTARMPLITGLAVPAGLAATDNDLWVSDWYLGMVMQLVKDGETLAEPIPVATNLSFPEGLAVDTDGNLLVVETGTGSLSKIDLKTGEISTIAKDLEVGAPAIPGLPPTFIFNGVAVSPSGTIYVTGDKSNVLYRIKAGS
jgi:sugar lactone lactonase YvrE